MAQSPELRRCIRIAAGFNRRAQRFAVPGRVSGAQLAWLEGEPCFYCGIGLAPGQGSFDHQIPFDRGGRNSIDNIVRCCMTCQRSKFTKTPEQLEAYRDLERTCPVDGRVFRPRWSDYLRGQGIYCSRGCAARSRWVSLSNSADSISSVPGVRAGKPGIGNRPLSTRP